MKNKVVSALAMTLSFLVLGGLVGLSILSAPGAKAAGPTCTPTGFYRDSINLTAARINPPGTFMGTLNATGCNIGIYYGPGASGTVYYAQIYGANYYGVVNNGGKVNVSHSRIHDIGESPLNGDQHGVAIYFSYASGATGEIANNSIWNYQKGGIVVNGTGDSAKVNYNTVTGQGPVNYIAQNGIQIGYGATATVSHNTVTGNSYTGAGLTASGGIIIVGGDCYGAPITANVQITGNTATGNDIGIWLSNLDANCGPVTTPTNTYVFENKVSNNAVNNTTGAGPGAGYQAGIVVQGDSDQIVKNTICGLGYTPVTTPPPYLFFIDDTVTNNPIESGNVTGTSCGASSSSEPAPTHEPQQTTSNPMP